MSLATARAVPVSRSEEKGTPAGTETVTASGQAVRRCSSTEPVAASSSGLPSGRVRTGARPATSGRAFPRPVSLTVAAAARASAVRASPASDGPGRISYSMIIIKLG